MLAVWGDITMGDSEVYCQRYLNCKGEECGWSDAKGVVYRSLSLQDNIP